CTAVGDSSGEWDHDRLGQVISNLAGNAVKYGEPGAPIDVLVRDEGHAVALEVHNWGAPVPEADQTHIFEPFRRARSAAIGRGEGADLGLGLFITREIVR